MRRMHLLVGFVVILATICFVYAWRPKNDIPDDPDEVILFSVDGTKMHMPPADRGFSKDQELLYDCAVLGKVVITDPALRRDAVASVKRDIRVGHSNQGKCLYFRHVLRVVKGGRSYDVVICFECHNYELHRDGGPHVGLTPPIGDESKPLLNKILSDAGVPIAP
ncbi:MAG: hypothetical protein C0467_31125 [Planctomycetaceae bacterium]|nr:hypothetical protein [Planctomycetaceae bacterium]